MANHRTLCRTVTLALLTVVLASLNRTAAQETGPTADENRDVIRETIEEKIRIDPARIESIPTVGEMRTTDSKDWSRAVQEDVDQRVSNESSPESEVHAVVNPTDPDNIVLSPIRQTIVGGQTQALDCPVYFTRDGGKTWETSSFVTGPPDTEARVFGGGDPVLAFDDNGRLYFVWLSLYVNSSTDSTLVGVYWAYSDDGGETWTQPEDSRVTAFGVDQPPPFGLFLLPLFPDKPWLAVDRSNSEWSGRLYCAYVELGLRNGSSEIVLRRFLPESGKFVDESVPVSTRAFNQVQFSSIDVDSEGRVHVSFFGNHSTEGWGLYHAVSRDGGESFESPYQISRVRMGGRRFGGLPGEGIVGIDSSRLYPAPHIAIVEMEDELETSNRIVAVWTGLGIDSVDGRGFSIYSCYSDDLGETWSTPQIVNDDETDYDQFYSSIGVNDDGVVAVSWYDKREDQTGRETHYRIACSFDGGATFGPSQSVTSEATDFTEIGARNNGFGIGEYTQVVVTPTHVVPVWSDGREGSGDMDIYAAFVGIDKSTNSVSTQADYVTSANSTLTSAQVIPNPVSDASARFEFTLREGADVSITVVDAAGREVLTLQGISGRPGTNSIDIETADWTDGKYFVRIAANGSRIVQPVTVAR